VPEQTVEQVFAFGHARIRGISDPFEHMLTSRTGLGRGLARHVAAALGIRVTLLFGA
jgi:hypothetical protein